MCFKNKLLLLLILVFTRQNVWAEQHSAVQRIIDSYKVCQPNYYFSRQEIKLNGRYYAFYEQLVKMLEPGQKRDFVGQIKDLYLVPINNCALKGNKNYSKLLNSELLKDFKVLTIVNTDFIAHSFNEGKNKFKYIFAPIEPGTYPNFESRKSIMLALDTLSRATPNERVFLGCLNGRYQSGLVAAMYQFAMHYAQTPELACTKLGTSQDLGYVEMNAIGNQGHLSYDMPQSYKKFYTGFAQSVCDGESAEFFQKNKIS
jgi:hypothetical protein